MKVEETDVLVVGAGPAGLVAARQLCCRGLRVLILEMGNSLPSRNALGTCRISARDDGQCGILCGVGGAAGTLGGKLCFFPAGERLCQHVGSTSEAANEGVTRFLSRFGCPFTPEHSARPAIGRADCRSDAVHLKEYRTHLVLRTELREFLLRLVRSVVINGGVLRPRTRALEIMGSPGTTGCRVLCKAPDGPMALVVNKAIVLAPGRSAASWMSTALRHLRVPLQPTAVDVGVRLLFPRHVLSAFPSHWQDPKFTISKGTPDEVRTLCWCRGGALTLTRLEGVCLVDGHFGDTLSPLDSVSIVARVPVPRDCTPFCHAEADFIRPAGLLRVQVQNLRAFLRMRIPKPRTTCSYLGCMAGDGNLAASMPNTYLDRITTMIAALDGFTAGALSACRDAAVCAPVVDRAWEHPVLDRCLMTNVPGVYVAGDATGLARGIVQAMFSGLIVAKAVGGTAGAHQARAPAFVGCGI